MVLVLYILGLFVTQFQILTITADILKKLPRYVVEEGIKPPIFGSYSYNPLTQKFLIKNETSSTDDVMEIEILNKTVTQLMSTQELPDKYFRKHVISRSPKQLKTFNWWPLLARNRTISDNVLRALASKNTNITPHATSK